MSGFVLSRGLLVHSEIKKDINIDYKIIYYILLVERQLESHLHKAIGS